VTTPTPRELSDRLVAEFDRQAELRLDRALIGLLRSMGLTRYKSEEVAWKLEDAVLRIILARHPEELPFRFCEGSRRLIGKARIGAHDNRETVLAKNAESLSPQLLKALLSLTPSDFEVVSAASMALSGARNVKALCTGDEGGIDFYGRLQVREPSVLIPAGIIHTTLLPKDLLLLGQAKLYQPHVRVGRPDIQQFKGQVYDCLKKYEGNQRPPSHRVPESYYRRDEPHLAVFVTTASFAETAIECVEASGIVLIEGLRLAQFLAFHSVGLVEDERGFCFDQDKLFLWLDTQRRSLT
jgi:hypothetical protein